MLSSIEQAVQTINNNECVVFPTETVYGLGANALCEECVSKIFQIKNRPPSNPLITHIASIDQVLEIATHLSPLEQKLFEIFSPGPLSIVLPKKYTIPHIVTGGLDTVGVRIPNHPLALEFLKQVNLPICAPSANISGKPSPTTFEMAEFYMKDKVSVILDGGDLDIGIESTVIKVIDHNIYILRSGFVTAEMIFEQTGIMPISTSKDFEHLSPGTRFAHYKPNAKVIVFEEDQPPNIFEKKSVCLKLSKKNYDVEFYTTFNSINEYAHHLYAIFFECDKKNITHIYCELPPNYSEGMALRDRLLRSAGY